MGPNSFDVSSYEPNSSSSISASDEASEVPQAALTTFVAILNSSMVHIAVSPRSLISLSILDYVFTFSSKLTG